MFKCWFQKSAGIVPALYRDFLNEISIAVGVNACMHGVRADGRPGRAQLRGCVKPFATLAQQRRSDRGVIFVVPELDGHVVAGAAAGVCEAVCGAGGAGAARGQPAPGLARVHRRPRDLPQQRAAGAPLMCCACSMYNT